MKILLVGEIYSEEEVIIINIIAYVPNAKISVMDIKELFFLLYFESFFMGVQ